MSTEMNDESVSPASKPASQKKGRWLDWLLLAIGLVCIGGFVLQAWRYERGKSFAITGQVMSGLTEVSQMPVTSGAAKDYNVIVISMDTTRADHLGCYGNGRVKTPNIDGLLQNGVLFEKAFTPSPSTLPGHSTIFTGLYPQHHGARANGTFHLAPKNTTLAETLKEVGYATGAVVSAYVLDSRFGLDQGIDDYNDDLTHGIKSSSASFRERPAELTNEAALPWIESHAANKFFLWVHYFDVHAPYLPPEPFRTQYQKHLYDGEIAYVDSMIGQLLGKLDALGVREKTLVVLVADHGESLGEHREQTHALLIYDPTMHTPMIFNSPGLFSEGSVVRQQVSNASVVPTVLDLLGVPSEEKYDGVSLLADGTTWPKGLYGESISTLVLHGWAPLFSIRHQGLKYIHAPRPELYDLVKDPRELVNLFSDPSYAAQVVELNKELDQYIGTDKFGADALAQVVDMDAETASKLHDLGYVATRKGTNIDVESAAALDPKDMIEHWEGVNLALTLQSQGKINEAIEILEAAVEEVPGDVFAMRTLAGMYSPAGRIKDAERMLLAAEALEKHEPGIYTGLAQISTARGDFDQARKYYALAKEIDPQYGAIYVGLGNVADFENKTSEAERYYRKAIEMDPGTTGPMAYHSLGMMYLRKLEKDKAKKAFEAALEIDTLHGASQAGLGSIMAEDGDYEGAREAFSKALRFSPNQPDVLAALAGLYDKLGEYGKARSYANRALELRATSRAAINNLALIEKHTGNLSKAIELLKKGLKLQPNDLPCRINLAQCYYAQRNEEKAAAEFRAVLKIDPRVPIALANLGTYHESHGRLDRAYKFYQRAVRVDPDYAYAHFRLASALLQRGDVQQGLVHFKKSIELDPQQPERELILTQIENLEKILKGANTSSNESSNESSNGMADTNGS